MKCERARQLAHEIVGGTGKDGVPGDRANVVAELEEHLWSCPECRTEMEELRVFRSRLRGLGNRRAPDGLVSRTMSAVRLEQRRRRRARRPVHVFVRRALAAAAAVAAIAAAGAYLAGQRPGDPTSTPTGGVSANVAPLVMEYADYRGAQPFGERDGMALIRARMEEEKQR